MQAENWEQALEFLKTVKPDQEFEIRVITGTKPHTRAWCQVFNSPEQAITALQAEIPGRFSGYSGVYWGLNSFKPGAGNRGSWGSTGVKAQDITRMNWALIDLDPIRPKGYCSTADEKAEAFLLADEVIKSLPGSPVVVDSGNGCHLLVKIDVKPGQAVKQWLQGLKRFDNGKIEIDQAVGDPARISKLPGTLARKLEAPGRQVSLAEFLSPGDLKTVDISAAVVEAEASGSDFESALKLAGVEPVKQGPNKWWVRCPWNPEHNGGDAAVFLNNGIPGFKCLHNSCSGHHWKQFSAKTKINYAGVVNPRDYLSLASGFKPEGLVYTQNEWMEFGARCYETLDPVVLRARVWHWLSGLKTRGDDGVVDLVPWGQQVNQVLDCLQGLCWAKLSDPDWITPGPCSPSDVLGFKNGRLRLDTMELDPHGPDWFSRFSCDADWDPNAECKTWHRFLNDLWPDDQESQDCLQLIFGYLLSHRTDLQKIFALIGPTRSGKGTIARVLQQLIPDTCGPGLGQFSQNFGLSALIDSSLAIIADARIGAKTDQASICERLLSISGRDRLNIPRKFKTDWSGTLNTRIMLLSNELPRIADNSAALAHRMVILKFNTSWLGREDLELDSKLSSELNGIARWAIEGWHRIAAGQVITTPKTAMEDHKDLEHLMSPVLGFVEQECCVDPNHVVTKDSLYEAWKSWCEAEGRSWAGTKSGFCRDLCAAVPGLTTVRTGSDRVRKFQGLTLKWAVQS
jgi:putative DNA primase/helicase